MSNSALAPPALPNPPDDAQEASAGEARASIMTPRWLDGELVLLRRAVFGSRTVLQGCWLDWPVIRHKLLDEVADLLPQETVGPIVDADAR